MVLLEYRTMLLGAEINIYTDHRNLTFNNFNTQRVLRWRCFVEDYSPKLYYLEGKNDVLADALSRLPRFDHPTAAEGKSVDSVAPPEPLDAYHAIDEWKLYDCLRDLPEMDSYFQTYDSLLNLSHSDDNPLSTVWLQETQQGEPSLLAKAEDADSNFYWRDFEGTKLVCHTADGRDAETDWRICLSDEALGPAIHWFHQLLAHPGKQRLLQAMDRYYHCDLRKKIDTYRWRCLPPIQARWQGRGTHGATDGMLRPVGTGQRGPHWPMDR